MRAEAICEVLSRMRSEGAAFDDILKEAVRLIRTTRSEFTITPEKTFPVYLKWDKNAKDGSEIEAKASLIQSFAKVAIEFGKEDTSKENAVVEAGSQFEVFLFVKELIPLGKILIIHLKKALKQRFDLFSFKGWRLGDAK